MVVDSVTQVWTQDAETSEVKPVPAYQISCATMAKSSALCTEEMDHRFLAGAIMPVDSGKHVPILDLDNPMEFNMPDLTPCLKPTQVKHADLCDKMA